MSQPATNVAEFTVSELSFALKRTVEANYEHVRVRGEISNFKGSAGSGHCYFRLKDDRACLEAVIWKTTLQRLRFKPQDGLEMVATGKLTTYPGRSNYQIVVEHLEPAGEGALMALLEERRRKLQAEGLFDQARKKPIPYLPRVIGVVTSPTGAVIRDILHRLRDRFPTHVLVWPVRVQGDGAAEEVAAAIRGFNGMAAGKAIPRPDLLIVARGGGSIEDLWAFNEEIAVRAVAASAIPTIAAVGHETDWTLIDYAADRRAPTPTGAAEMAVPVRAELLAMTRELASRQELAIRRGAETRGRELVSVAKGLPRLTDLLALPRQKLDYAGERLSRSLGGNVAAKRQALATCATRHGPELLVRSQARRAELLRAAQSRLVAGHLSALRNARWHLQQVGARHTVDVIARGADRRRANFEAACRLYQTLKETVSPEAILARGYALVTDREGQTVRSAADVSTNDNVKIFLASGEISAIVIDAAGTRGLVRPKRRPASKLRVAVLGQGTLF